MKKLLLTLLIITLSISLLACSTGNNNTITTTDNPNEPTNTQDTTNDTLVNNDDNKPKENNDGKIEVTDNNSNPKPSPTTSPTPKPSTNPQTTTPKPSANDWNGGLNTDPTIYGLDPDNEWVKAAMNLVGEEGRCDIIAGQLFIDVGGTLGTNTYKSKDWADLSGCVQIGDRITYTNLNGKNINHMAVYLGNGLALQGNWTGGVARISSVDQPAEWYSVRTNNNYDDCAKCSSCGFGSNPTSDEEWQAKKDAVNPSVCDLKTAFEMTLEERTVCGDLGKLRWE